MLMMIAESQAGGWRRTVRVPRSSTALALLAGVLLFIGVALTGNSPGAIARVQAQTEEKSQIGPAAPLDCAGWNVVPSPNANQGNYLRAVATVSAGDVWAVGWNSDVLQTLVEHWNGTSWSIVPSPNPGSAYNMLNGVAAISANDVWAVGRSNNGSVDQALIEHWNGSSWNIVPSPTVISSSLNSVAGVSASDVWAVGTYSNGTFQPLVEHWNGTSWTIVSSPNAGSGTNILNGVAAAPSGDVWAVGQHISNNVYQTLVEHWNGSSWSVVPSPNSGSGSSYLNGVAVASSGDMWAVGYYDSGIFTPRHSLIEHWNGTAWVIVPGPDPGSWGNELNGMAAASSGDVWAVGNYFDGNNGNEVHTLVEHWNGSSWAIIPSPEAGAGNNTLLGIAAASSDDVWAVGSYFGGAAQTLVEHWNSRSWSVVPSPNSGTRNNALIGVAVASANDVWAVGYYNDSPRRTLIEHWNGSSWSIVYSPNSGSGDNILNGVAVASSGDVWAVGYYHNGLVFQTLVEHWTGGNSNWTIVSSPNSGSQSNILSGVSVASANDVWAVGNYHNVFGTVAFNTLVEHWDGSSWTLVNSPHPSTSDNELNGVVAIAANDVWAVGAYYDDIAAVRRTLVEHWNGSSWSLVPSPNPGSGGNVLYGVAATSSTDVWSVGYYVNGGASQPLVAHWNGSGWSVVPSPGPGPGGSVLRAISVVSSSDTWAVGDYYYLGNTQTLIEHWNGSSWSLVSGPNLGSDYNQLQGVAVASANDVWAVGKYGNGPVRQTLVERYSLCPPTPTPTPTPTPIPSPVPTSCSIQFNDAPAGSPFYQFVRCLACRNILSGYQCGDTGEPCPGSYFRPNANVTRGQAAKIIANAAGYSDAIPASRQSFADVAPSSPFWVFVERVYLHGAISGYSCGGVGEPCPGAYFRPGANLTRGQLAKIATSVAGYSDVPTGQAFNDVSPNSPFYVYIERARIHNVISGYPCGAPQEPCPGAYFRPGSNVTRGQTAKIVSSTFFPNCQTANATKP